MCYDQQVLQTTCGYSSLYVPPTALITSGTTPPLASSEGVRGPLTCSARASASIQGGGFPQLPRPGQSKHSNTPYPFPNLAPAKPRADREPLVGPSKKAAPQSARALQGGHLDAARGQEPGWPAAPRVPAELSLLSPAPTLQAARVVSRRPRPALSAPTERSCPAPQGLSSSTQPAGPACPPPPGARPEKPPPQDRRHLPPHYLPPSEPGGAAPTALRKPPGTQRTPALIQCAPLATGSPGRQNPREPLRAPHPPAAATAPANARRRLGAGPGSGCSVPFPAEPGK
ncbi:basic proline-rich protein-like [Marmota flaviventris]|uniref:basic proline-rich protein-like n=1 Tax=Marmota flaviventris TaxID=93162 RepID=UPI003A8544BC